MNIYYIIYYILAIYIHYNHYILLYLLNSLFIYIYCILFYINNFKILIYTMQYTIRYII